MNLHPSLVFLAGLGIILLGAELVLRGAARIAVLLGVKPVIIGLTIVSVGTSMPELAVGITAVVDGLGPLAVGNIAGTNILVILGITCIAAPHGVAVSRDVLWFDLPLAAAVAIACYPVFRSDRMVSRKEGIAFVLSYLVYLGTLVFLRA